MNDDRWWRWSEPDESHPEYMRYSTPVFPVSLTREGNPLHVKFVLVDEGTGWKQALRCFYDSTATHIARRVRSRLPGPDPSCRTNSGQVALVSPQFQAILMIDRSPSLR